MGCVVTLWQSERVTPGTAAGLEARGEAERIARANLGRVEWRDEYNDYSVKGRYAVVSRRTF